MSAVAVPLLSLAVVVGAVSPTAAQEQMRPLEESAEESSAVSFPNSSTIGAVHDDARSAQEEWRRGTAGEVIIDDPGTDLNRQINTLRTWIQQKVAVIVGVVPNPAAFERIAEAGP